MRMLDNNDNNDDYDYKYCIFAPTCPQLGSHRNRESAQPICSNPKLNTEVPMSILTAKNVNISISQ